MCCALFLVTTLNGCMVCRAPNPCTLLFGCSCPLLCEDPELSAGLSDTAALLRRYMAEAGLLMVGRAPARPRAAPGTRLSS